MFKLLIALSIFINVASAAPLFKPVKISKRCYWQPIAKIICNIGGSGEIKYFEGCDAALASKEIPDEDKTQIRSNEVCQKGFVPKTQMKTE